MQQVKGFILTIKTQDYNGKAVISLYCRGDKGPFVVKIDNQKPVFFVEHGFDCSNVTKAFEQKTLNLKSFGHKKVDGLYFQTQADYFEARDQLKDAGQRTYEADIRHAERYLMERYINGSIEVLGVAENTRGLVTYRNPELRKIKYHPKFEILSLDIETSLNNDLFSIAFHQKGSGEIKNKILMVGPERETDNPDLEFCINEKKLLHRYLELMAFWDPDIILGWHVIGFDFSFLQKKCDQYKIQMRIGRNNGNIYINERRGSGWFASLDGRVILDGPAILRGAFYQFENFKLDTVAHEVLNTHKDIESTGHEKVAEIERRFHNDKEALAKYNLMDCILVTDIFEKLNIIDLLLTRVEISGMLLDRIGVSTAAFDHFFLPQFHRKGFVASNILDINREGQAAGGYVLEPKVGLHEHVIVVDFKSLYPTIINTFKIDPLSNLLKDVDPLTTPSGHQFSRTEHILPDFIEALLAKRKIAKDQQNTHLSQAIKILMNSFYGVMGSGGSRFYNSDLPSAITETGQWILRQTIDHLTKEGYQVLYGDTDSIFYKLKAVEVTDPFEKGSLRAKRLNEFLTELLSNQFKVDSHLEIEFETYYKRFYLSPVRGGVMGAKKKYAGLILNRSGQEEMEFKGLEVVRSDWTKLAKKFQYELFEKLFHDQDIFEIIKNIVSELKESKHDNDLIYKKRLTKPASEYIKTIPPHVRAALILDPDGTKRIKEIEYYISTTGPMPFEGHVKNVDYQHYIDKQLKPVAEGVLFIYEKSFEDIIVGDQLSLF
jgi:DNA polymerase II